MAAGWLSGALLCRSSGLVRIHICSSSEILFVMPIEWLMFISMMHVSLAFNEMHWFID